MNFVFSDREESFKPNIFSVLNEKKNQMIKEGKTVYNLSVGTPDFKPDAHVMQAVSEAALNPDSYKYALADMPELLEAVQNWYKRRYDVTLETDEIMSVYGSQEGITHVCLALCNEGDTVLVPDPCYPIFSTAPFLAGAKLEYYQLVEENNYLPDLDNFDEELAKKAKVMIVSFPANPVCKTAPDEFYVKLIAFAKKYNIIIIHDNAYSEIIFDGRQGTSFLKFEGAKDVGIEFNSLSKSYNLTGARISFALGNKEIISKFKNIRTQIDYGIFIPVQKAAIAALNGPQDILERNRLEYQKRRDALCGGLRKIGWNVPDSEGTMFAWGPLPKGYTNSEEFCMELLEKTGVICTPGSSFGSLGEGHVRFALVLPVEKIEELIDAIDKSGIIKK
ncbi:LL-diaminopimelate aminotransferase [Tyzzerella sp. An114]|uniref:aminotransferase class I/II-fold pyridoxal phosphate-dependent enzyme n=1 Tax=Tyzzerella sp. An114 TaxID=1965545 RepID=UPI000B43667A|nr:aminotransferase class I/II-fold pyridoxal phosphate-dependent enzyme [Tyzzerella sp. An114]OUQ58522.1 LL-diaminopimelate aminotransferase [Tyzzerella sp. An114]HIT72477.1 aminotransferase class I/II-fold pyridoxal phosphate-dependent enzyme [Candidatus Fimicola cottocaccae]